VIRILDRLVLQTFLKLFFVVLVTSPPLFVIGDIAENLDEYIDRGLTGMEIARSYVYQIPLFMQWSFPIAALIAAVFTVHGMTTHREIVAAKAGGISFHRLVLPLFFAGAGLTVLALGLTEAIPHANKISAQIRRSEAPGRSWRSDFVYRSEEGLTWQVDRLTAADGRMTGVVIERPETPERLGLHVVAEGGRYDEDDGWTWSLGYVRTLLPDSTEQAMEFEHLTIPQIREKPDELLEVPPAPDEMTYAEINRMARIVERTGGNANELLVNREQKISIPVTTLVIILFGAPLATSTRRGGAAYGIGLSLATVLVFLMMMRVSAALGEAGALSPFAAAWLPNGIFLTAGAAFMLRVRT
jgi:lipopolysaccharide export system permease protein